MLYYIKPETQLFTLEDSNALISKTAIEWMDALMNAVCINITLTTIFPSLIKQILTLKFLVSTCNRMIAFAAKNIDN